MPRLLPPCSALIFVLLGAACAERTPAGDPAARSGATQVTDAMLRNPDPADWLMYSRTYDAQRFSPLDEIDRGNVGSLELARLKRVFGIDIEQCARCGGRLRVIASIEEPQLIQCILAHQRERGEDAPPISPLGARAPPQASLF